MVEFAIARCVLKEEARTSLKVLWESACLTKSKGRDTDSEEECVRAEVWIINDKNRPGGEPPILTYTLCSLLTPRNMHLFMRVCKCERQWYTHGQVCVHVIWLVCKPAGLRSVSFLKHHTKCCLLILSWLFHVKICLLFHHPLPAPLSLWLFPLSTSQCSIHPSHLWLM